MNAIEFLNEMDYLAQVHFGEFGYDTCSYEEKQAIANAIMEKQEHKQTTKQQCPF